MSRQDAAAGYIAAQKKAKQTYKDCILRGKYPYLQVLDEILDPELIGGQVDVGLIDIPIDEIVGTKTKGRVSAFSADFMPLLDAKTEFASKWMTLCEAQMGDEGIKDPIRCYEYMGRFYVQEGNKRVSVLKSAGAVTIPGYVLRMIPVYSEDPEIKAYYDFLSYYPLTGLYSTRMSRAGHFAKLQSSLGYNPKHKWSNEEQKHFRAGLTWLEKAYRSLGVDLPITMADVVLVWLKFYPFEDLTEDGPEKIKEKLATIISDVEGFAKEEPVHVNIEGEQEVKSDAPGIIGKIFNPLPKHLNIAFINEQAVGESDWTKAHDLGATHLKDVLEDKITVESYYGVGSTDKADQAFDRAVEKGAEVIFTTTPALIGASRRAAAKYPSLKIMNCSIQMPYIGVRTYYNRIYEGKFITGALAGALSKEEYIGYVASAPIFGVPAGINAFALGAAMTNPNAKILLKWSCTQEDPMKVFKGRNIKIVSNRDIPTPDRMEEGWGLCSLEDGEYHTLASPVCNWGSFYVRLVNSIFSGAWDSLGEGDKKAVNYWWGLRNGTTGVVFGEKLPSSLKRMAKILSEGISFGYIQPFHTDIYSSDKVKRNDEGKWLSMEEILNMDWLCDNVVGEIPKFEELLPVAKSNVRLLGIYRDKIPPEKEGIIL